MLEISLELVPTTNFKTQSGAHEVFGTVCSDVAVGRKWLLRLLRVHHCKAAAVSRGRAEPDSGSLRSAALSQAEKRRTQRPAIS